VSLVTSNLLSVIDGSTYVNFHTTNYPAAKSAATSCVDERPVKTPLNQTQSSVPPPVASRWAGRRAEFFGLYLESHRGRVATERGREPGWSSLARQRHGVRQPSAALGQAPEDWRAPKPGGAFTGSGGAKQQAAKQRRRNPRVGLGRAKIKPARRGLSSTYPIVSPPYS